MTEQNRWKRGDPESLGWYVVRFRAVREWCYTADYWLGCVDGWGIRVRRDTQEHLPLRLEDCLEPLP